MVELNAVVLVLFLSSCTLRVESQRQHTIGSDITTPFSQSRDERLFMNFGAPAQYNGTVTSWRYCSYNRYLQGDSDSSYDDDSRSGGGRQVYTSAFLVYRQNGRSTQYAPVPGSTKYVTITLRSSRDGGFQCREATLSQAEQFNVQLNDVVAACLLDTSPIRVVGRSSSGSSKVYRYSSERCTSGRFQTVDSNNRNFGLSSQSILHLYAKINVDPATAQLNGGSNPPPFTPFINSGTYLNRAHPINRTDTITSWNYCYYPSMAGNSQQTYTATVGVWRLNRSTQQYDLLPGSDYTLELVSPANTPAKIFCKREYLQPSEYVGVQTGDIVGASLPAQNPLPIVASDATGFGLTVHETQTTPAALQMATLNDVSDMALHLFPTVEFAPTQPPVIVRPPTPQTPSPQTPSQPTPSRPVTPSTMVNGGGEGTAWPTDTEWPINSTPWPNEAETDAESQQESARRGTFRGDYIAIGVGALVVLIIVIVSALIVAYKCRSSRRKGPSHFNEGRQDIEISLTQQRLLTGSLVSNGSSLVPVPIVAPYVPKIENPYDSLASLHQQMPSITNMNAPVYYSKLGPSLSTTDYSLILEQAMEGKSFEGEEDPYFLPAKKERDLYDQLHQQGITTIKSDDIEVINVLGAGQFGTVSQGIWRNGTGYVLEVAVKTLKTNSEDREKVKFLQEATIMAQFKHPNVVSLYGVVSSEPMMIVVELLPNGDLQQHLIDMRSNPEKIQLTHTPRKLLGYCQQIALGMQYLSTKGFVHRDLAARNILLSEEGICKIADFGMSVDLAEGNYYVAKGGRIPLKWTAPEALHYRKYSTASDIWSYACVLYEIWTLGQKPFGITKNRTVIAQIDSGYRLPPPPGCPKAIYKVMIDCWHPTTTKRPAFRNILLALLENEEKVLSIPREVPKNSPARELGGPVESGFNMYTQLQNTYRSEYA